MTRTTERPQQDFIHQMKRDWDARARENAKWFINTLKSEQSDAEFDETGRLEVEKLILADLPLVLPGRDPKSMRMLEIGCGIGRMTRHLADIFGEVCATDVSGEMIRQAQQRLQPFANVRLVETSGRDFTEFPDGYFDFVFSGYVFQHVPSAEIIRANIVDAYRTLKPGGVIRFQTSGLSTQAFAEVEKNTWTGTPFSEAELRRTASELNAQLISLYGAETQYCWTTLRKRLAMTGSAASIMRPQPRIESYGRADDFQIKEIPVRGPHACLALKVSGLAHDEADANDLIVEINGHPVQPIYVGPDGAALTADKAADQGAARETLTQINLRLPSGQPHGQATVRVRLNSDEASLPITIELLEPPLIMPEIVLVRNDGDEGLDIYARGPKSALVIYATGLDETADTSNVRVQIGVQFLTPSFVGFVPANGVYQINAQLPADIAPGETSLRLHFGNLTSPIKPLHIK